MKVVVKMYKNIKLILIFVIILILLLICGCKNTDPPGNDEEGFDYSTLGDDYLNKYYDNIDYTQYESAIEYTGNNYRMKQFIKKAELAEEPLNVVFFGGSITAGASATSNMNYYGNKFGEQLFEMFPEANISLFQSGLGSTNAVMGASRVKTEVLNLNPDLVVLDFGVNNEGTNEEYSAYEAMARRILESDSETALIIITFTQAKSEREPMSSGTGSTVMNIAKNLGIPVISYHNYLWNLISADETLKFTDYGAADFIHPIDAGHDLAAKLLTSYIKYVKDADSDEKLVYTPSISKNEFMNARDYIDASVNSEYTDGVYKIENRPNMSNKKFWTYNGWQSGKDNTLKIPFQNASKLKLALYYGVGQDKPEGTIKVTVGGKTTILDVNDLVRKLYTVYDGNEIIGEIVIDPSGITNGVGFRLMFVGVD